MCGNFRKKIEGKIKRFKDKRLLERHIGVERKIKSCLTKKAKIKSGSSEKFSRKG